jgi:cytoskeletal protein CcmA (bactofilin family)
MAWFKQTDQKSPEFPESQTPAPPAAGAATPANPSSAQGEQRRAPTSPAVAASPVSPATSRVSRGLVLRGEITGAEDLSIDGEVEGTLRLEGARVTVGPAGRVRASVNAREIVVHGEVRGELCAEDRIEIGSTGSVEGNATAKRIAIEDGAVFNGSIEVSRPGETAGSGGSGGGSRTGVRPTPRATSSTAKDSPARAGEKKTDAVWRDEPDVSSDSVN